MVASKYCPDCGTERPACEFTRDSRRADGLAFYCRDHARRRVRESRRRRVGPPSTRFVVNVDVPEGSKWCPDCGTIKPLADFPTNRSNKIGVHTYCKPCHNVRGKVSVAKVGGSRTYHLKRRYGITAADFDVMSAEQGGLCAICRNAPAEHVDHDHVTGRVRQLCCFNCNGGLGQFKDDPIVLRAAAEYVERHRDGKGQPETPRRGRRSQFPAHSELRRRASGCPSHDVVRARVAALIASLHPPATG